jgi:hypothetical protein
LSACGKGRKKGQEDGEEAVVARELIATSLNPRGDSWCDSQGVAPIRHEVEESEAQKLRETGRKS